MNAVNYYMSLPKETLLESLELATNELLSYIKETILLNEKTESLINDETKIRAIYGVNKYAEIMKNHATELNFKLKEIAGRCTILDNQLNKIQHMIRTNEKWLTTDNTTTPQEIIRGN